MNLSAFWLVAFCGVALGAGSEFGRVIDAATATRDELHGDASAFTKDILKVVESAGEPAAYGARQASPPGRTTKTAVQRRRLTRKRLDHLIKSAANGDHLQKLLRGGAVKADTKLVSALKAAAPTVDVTGMVGQLQGMVEWLRSHFTPSADTLKLLTTSLQNYDRDFSAAQKDRILRMINVVRGLVNLITSPEVTAYMRSLVEPEVIVEAMIHLHAQGLSVLKEVEQEMGSQARNEL